jgi:hypothetical protein
MRWMSSVAVVVCSAWLGVGCLGSAPVDSSPTPSPPGGDTTMPGAGASAGDAGTSLPADAAVATPMDAAPPPDSATGPTLPPLTECATPSVDRLQQWLASGEGTTIPATGSILARDGARYVAKVEMVNAEWHVVPIWIGNKFEASVDLTGSAGLTLTYSATDDFYIQMRPAAYWSGGDKYLTKLPSTGGQVQTRSVSFASANWTTLPELGTPPYPYAEARKDVRGFVVVGKTANKLAFYGLRIEGYVPPCL